MFRSPQYVMSACLLGTYRSLLLTVKDLQKPTLGRTVCSIPPSRKFGTVIQQKGHLWKQPRSNKSWNISCISQEVLLKPFSCLVNTRCSVKSLDLSHNATHLRNVSKHYINTTLSPFTLRDSIANKCLVLKNQTVKHRFSVDKWTTHTTTSIQGQKNYHIVMGAASYKGNYRMQHEFSRRTSAGWRCCGLRTTQTYGLHKTVSHQAPLEECLSVENEARCRGHLHPNAALYDKERGKSWAAVLVSLCTVGGDPAFLFTLRSSKLRGRHKGDVSFAGGKRDPSDKNVVDTALREAREELGITVTENKVWGVLKPLSDAAGMMIAPVVANLGPLETLTFRPNPTEVEEVFTLTVSHVCNPHNRGYTHFRTGDRYGYTLPVFHNSKYRIWGLTAVALDHTLKLILPT